MTHITPNTKNIIHKRKWDILLLSLLFCAVGFLFLLRFVFATPGATVVICKVTNGTKEELYRIPLQNDTTLCIGNENDDYNVVIISDGKVFVADANCPHHLCRNQKAISRAGQSIICLPHQLMITIEGESQVDFTVGGAP